VFLSPFFPSIRLSLSLFYFIVPQWPPFSCLSPKQKRSLFKGMKQFTLSSNLLHCISFPINVRVP
jgi:hypothetical protein